MVTRICRYECCQRIFLPLKLAYGKTVHTFQGQSAGPTEKGKSPNQIQKIVVDPGTKQFEALNIGLFYSLYSRATTTGTSGAKRMDSAIYFKGNNMSKYRVLDLTKKTDGTSYLNVIKRDRWVRRLNRYQTRVKMDKSEMEEIKLFTMATRISGRQWNEFIWSNKWRSNRGMNY